MIEINGTGVAGNGFLITGDDVVIRGLAINQFTVRFYAAVTISGGANNAVQGCFVGTDITGTIAAPNVTGVWINSGATNNWIGTNGDGIDDEAERNLISSNGGGLSIQDAGTEDNVVAGNLIGTDQSGTVALGQQADNILIAVRASQNRVGTNFDGVSDALERNVIGGGRFTGVAVYNDNTDNNVIAGNFIGLDATGTMALGNGNGIAFSYDYGNIGASGTQIIGNVISGNGAGVSMDQSNHDTLIAGNFIGTTPAGTGAIPNGDGLDIAGYDNTIGGTTAATRNVISGNNGFGVLIHQTAATGNMVMGNYIGTTGDGTTSLGNARSGIEIANAPNNLVGGSDPAARNVIAGNGNYGVYLTGSQTTGNHVQGNYLGTDANGTSNLGVQTEGIAINAGAYQNWIGTDGDGNGDATEGNLISGNVTVGVFISDGGTHNNVVAGKSIGTDVTGSVMLANGGNGVYIGGGATANRVGTNGDGIDDDDERNVISGNAANGVLITGSGTNQNVVAGNDIGAAQNGTDPVGNAQTGIRIDGGASYNSIGGTTTAARNIIGGNGNRGVYLKGTATRNNVVAGNYIGVDVTGEAPLPNQLNDAVSIDNASHNTIGGTTAGAGNVLSAGHDSGIYVYAGSYNLIAGNLIGTDASGTLTAGFGSQHEGVTIDSGSNNTVGGITPEARNVISGNLTRGVLITAPDAPATGNIVVGNVIGTDMGGTLVLGNGGDGVQISNNAQNNVIGGDAAGEANTVAFNDGNGVTVVGALSTGNAIRANSIHDNGLLGLDLGDDGVTLNDSSGHAGPNLFQNFPILSSAINSAATTIISGTLAASPNTSYRIDLFSNPAMDPSGYGQGEVFLMYTDVTTDPTGQASFMVDTPTAVAVGQFISASRDRPGRQYIRVLGRRGRRESSFTYVHHTRVAKPATRPSRQSM